ncbi:hypothetical protein HPB51_027029 [Rhipicephalus microplus]|uniref:Uncharacterized protein n=1 Tax=Rhipicephalus microplus TaxID=6941 RepID=A0A9J6D1D4_RHIMP|nr:hypothetical protein HPB51_027029 [Rhipicephalus microplus]
MDEVCKVLVNRDALQDRVKHVLHSRVVKDNLQKFTTILLKESAILQFFRSFKDEPFLTICAKSTACTESGTSCWFTMDELDAVNLGNTFSVETNQRDEDADMGLPLADVRRRIAASTSVTAKICRSTSKEPRLGIDDVNRHATKCQHHGLQNQTRTAPVSRAYLPADPQGAGSYPGCGGCISDGGGNVVGPCAQIWVHVKEPQVV